MKALIVFASLTGNTEEMAYMLGEKLRKLNVETEVEECMQLYPEEFKEVDLCIVATYTYGADGNLPDEIIDFYDDLQELDLTGKIYGVLGSGQTFYEHFCRAVDYFEQQFEKTNATKGADSLKFELNISEEEEYKLDEFSKSLVDAYHKMKH